MPHTRPAAATTNGSVLAPRLFGLAILAALVMFILVGSGAQAQTPSPTATPARRLELAPIEAAEVQVLKTQPPQYQLMVTSGLPGGCAAFDSITVKRDGTRIDVTVMNSMPTGTVPCTAIYGYKDSTLNMGADFAAGTTYTVVVNAGGARALTKTFTTASAAPAPDGTAVPTPVASPSTRPAAPLPANVGTGGVPNPVAARGTQVSVLDAAIGASTVLAAVLAVLVIAIRVPRSRG